jgi:hypothetical protein
MGPRLDDPVPALALSKGKDAVPLRTVRLPARREAPRVDGQLANARPPLEKQRAPAAPDPVNRADMH